MHTVPQSVAPSVRYVISDNNARETAGSIEEAIIIVEEWYDYIDGGSDMLPDSSEVKTLEDLQQFIRDWEHQIAHIAQGFNAVSGHGNYNVSPADRMGLCLKVTAETIPGQYAYATDGDSGTITATDFDDAKRQLVEMFTEEILADGGSGWVDDVDGTRYWVE